MHDPTNSYDKALRDFRINKTFGNVRITSEHAPTPEKIMRLADLIKTRRRRTRLVYIDNCFDAECVDTLVKKNMLGDISV